MRINKIVFAFRNGVWPKPMEGLNMFQPLVQADGVPVEQSSSSEWSDSESMDSPSASDTDLNSEPEQNIISRTSDSALPLEINQSGILSSKVKEIKAVSRTLAIEDRSSTGGLQKVTLHDMYLYTIYWPHTYVHIHIYSCSREGF